MDLTGLERRMLRLETLASRLKLVKALPMGEPVNDKVSALEQLEDIAKELTLLREETHVSGDHRLALAYVHEFCHVVELAAKLEAGSDGTQSRVLNIDSATAKRMAQAYLDRHKKDGQSDE